MSSQLSSIIALVSIHPFPNGNGRHSRFCADRLIETSGGRRSPGDVQISRRAGGRVIATSKPYARRTVVTSPPSWLLPERKSDTQGDTFDSTERRRFL